MAKKKPAGKRGAGKPPYEPTEQERFLVKMMAGCRLSQDEMVTQLINPRTKQPISPVTLRKVFENELRVGYANLKLRMIGASVRSAEGIRKLDKDGKETDEWILRPDSTAQIWLQKVLFGMKETTDVLLPPVAGDAEGGSMLDAARRVAFTLAHGAQLARKS